MDIKKLSPCHFCKSTDLELTDVWAEDFEEECACCNNCHAQVPVKVWNKALSMPKELTAENGAKGLLSGEFSEEVTVDCHECGGLGHNQYIETCELCEGDGSLIQKVPVQWTTIKEIYTMAVESLGNAE